MQFLRTSTCIWTYHLNHKQTPNLTQQRSNKKKIKSLVPHVQKLETQKSWKPRKVQTTKIETPHVRKLETQKSLNNKNWNSSCPKTGNPEKLKTQKTSNNKNWNSLCQQKLKLLRWFCFDFSFFSLYLEGKSWFSWENFEYPENRSKQES